MIELTKLGTAYFYDGHTEDIFRYITHRDDDCPVIEFHTPNGMYVFRAYITQDTSTMTRIVNYIALKDYVFYRVAVEIDQYGYLGIELYRANIERIEILKEKER